MYFIQINYFRLSTTVVYLWHFLILHYLFTRLVTNQLLNSRFSISGQSSHQLKNLKGSIFGVLFVVCRLYALTKDVQVSRFCSGDGWNVNKTEMSLKLKLHQNWNATKAELSQKVKCLQNWNVTKTKMSQKLKCHQNWNVTKPEMSPKLKCHQN